MEAELKVANFVADNNVSVNVAENLTELFKDIFPDSKIAADIK